MIETENRSLLLWSSKEKCLILKSEPIFISRDYISRRKF